MPNPDWINEEGLPFVFIPFDTRQYRGNLLNGSVASQAKTKQAEILRQEWSRGFYAISYRSLLFFENGRLDVYEPRDLLRVEIMISGELNIVGSGGPARLRQSYYQFTKEHHFTALAPKEKGCEYFVCYLSSALLNELQVSEDQLTCNARLVPEPMLKIIYEALHHPYRGDVCDIYYRKLVTELVFIHLTSSPIRLPSELTEKDIAAIYQADAIIARDLSEHYSILKLAAMTGTNAFKLKRGFRLIFKMGVFARLLFRRMEHAKMLLTTTDKPVKEVAFESGYSTVGGFINAFRRRFRATPMEWREGKRRKE